MKKPAPIPYHSLATLSPTPPQKKEKRKDKGKEEKHKQHGGNNDH